ncbi:MAG TPA: hypothetical protein VFB74_36160 [Kribbellaceae bacterium]|nr:hypothetical protein [Kribbellaceae bacterium]
MAWDWGPTFGAFIGAGIPAALTYAALRADARQRRHARQWEDADVVADVQALLSDIDPMRRTINLDPVEGAETARWEDLDARTKDVSRRLLRLGAGHPSHRVRTLAQRLAVEVLNAATATKWVVSDMLKGRDGNYMEVAQRDHETANATALELKAAVESAGNPPGAARWWFFHDGPRT